TRLFLTPACPPPPRAIAVEATTGTSRSLLSPSGPPPLSRTARPLSLPLALATSPMASGCAAAAGCWLLPADI
ncbi:Os10g0341800, partial [Oryza sativa Japonica Group]